MVPNKKQSVNIQYVQKGWAAVYHWRGFGSLYEKVLVEEGEKARKKKRGMWRHELTVPEDSAYRTLNHFWIAPSELTIRGRVRNVTSGETLKLEGQDVRLAGLDAAKDEWCGGELCAFGSRRALAAALAKDRKVACAPAQWDTRDALGATMAMCTTHDPDEGEYCDRKDCWLNWQQTAGGHAIGRRNRKDESEMFMHIAWGEDEAIRARRGIWRMNVDLAAMAEEGTEGLPWHEGREKVKVRGVANVLAGNRLRVADTGLELWGNIGSESEWCKSRRNRNCEEQARAAFEEATDGKVVECSYPAGTRWNDAWKRALCSVEKGCEDVRCTLNYAMAARGGECGCWTPWTGTEAASFTNSSPQ